MRIAPGTLAALTAIGMALASGSAAGQTPQAAPTPSDAQELDFASRGFIATRNDPLIRTADGHVAFDLNAVAFVDGPLSPDANPLLQRQARLLHRHGLFQVVDGVYQVRGFDLANITFIRGSTGWIIIDPLTAPETARAALDLVSEHLGKRPVAAVIYTHSHIDHFGGAAGVITREDATTGRVKVIAPDGFLKEATQEWVLAGPAMMRRTEYASGMTLPHGPQGFMGMGIGPGAAHSNSPILPPNVTIDKPMQEMTVDGVKLVFQLTPNTEAPAEMNIYLPQFRVLDMAENAVATQHNVLTPRGAQVRDAKAWADDIAESMRLFDGKADVLIVSHTWPRFGAPEIRQYLGNQRDAYEFLHDQVVRMMNDGLTGPEIANRIQLPPSLAQYWYVQDFYGKLSFNARAVYQRYMGFYDGNPVHLAVLDPVDEARRTVEAMGGAARVIDLAKAAIAKNDNQWAAVLLNNVVMADDKAHAARMLLAELYRRMAFADENFMWRNMYLSAAQELANGIATGGIARLDDPQALAMMATASLLDLFATRLDPAKVRAQSAVIDLHFTDRPECVRLRVHNQALTHEACAASDHPAGDRADASVTLSHAALVKLLSGQDTTGEVAIEGARASVVSLGHWFSMPAGRFPLVWR